MSPVPPEGDEGAREFLVGDLVLVRTFRLAADARLYPIWTTAPWTAGTISAFCKKGLPHTPPAVGCTCGFYAYSDPAYLGEQAPWRNLIAVVAMTGTVDISTRGARSQHARIQALWIGPRVKADLERRLAINYPGVPLYRDRARMFAEHPLTGEPVFPAPRYDSRARANGRRAMWAYGATAFAGGLIPGVRDLASPPAAALWLALILGGLAVIRAGRIDRSPIVTMFGIIALTWLFPNVGSFSGGIHAQGVITAVMSTVAWGYRGRPGMPPPPPQRSQWRPVT